MTPWKQVKSGRYSAEVGEDYRRARISHEFGCRARELREAGA